MLGNPRIRIPACFSMNRLFGRSLSLALVAVMAMEMLWAKEDPARDPGTDATRVPIELFVRFDCPYSLKAFLEVERVMERTERVEVHVFFLVAAGRSVRPELGMAQFYGNNRPSSVLLSLVATTIEKLYPDQLMRFVELGLRNPDSPWRTHVRQLGIPVETIAEFLDSEAAFSWFGKNVSAARDLRITVSPTVIIGEHRLEGAAFGELDLRYRLCEASEATLGTKLCGDLPECLDGADCPPIPGMTVFCADGGCQAVLEAPFLVRILTSTLIDPEHLRPSIERLEQIFPSASFDMVPLETLDGKALFEEYGPPSLPLFVFPGNMAAYKGFDSVKDFHPVRGNRPASGRQASPKAYTLAGCLIPHPLRTYGFLAEDETGHMQYVLTRDMRATALQGIGALDQAEALYLEHLGENPTDARAHTNLALLYLERGDFDKAFQSVGKAILSNPDYENAYRVLSLIAEKRGDTDSQMYANLEAALHSLKKEHYRTAAVQLERIMDAGCRLPVAIHGLCRAYRALGAYAKTIDLLERLETTRSDATLLSIQGNAYLHLGKHARAAEVFSAALQLDSQSERSVIGLAQALIGESDLERADGALRKYLAAHRSLRAASKRAETLWALGRYKDIFPLFQGYRDEARVTEAYALHYFTGRALLESGERERALEVLYPCLGMGVRDPEFLFNLARVFTKAGDSDAAASVMEQLLKIRPADARGHAYLAEIYCQLTPKRIRDSALQAKLARQFGLSRTMAVTTAE